jgi:hypothetical protein
MLYNKLPRSPSRLIRMALKDLEAAEKAGYVIDMDLWYERDGNVCAVCLAGGVIVRRMPVSDGSEHNPTDLAYEGLITVQDQRALEALNYFRMGKITEGLNRLRVRMPGGWTRSPRPVMYSGNGGKFKDYMRKLVKRFEKVEL